MLPWALAILGWGTFAIFFIVARKVDKDRVIRHNELAENSIKVLEAYDHLVIKYNYLSNKVQNTSVQPSVVKKTFTVN